MNRAPTVYLVVPGKADLESSFIRAHIDRLPAKVVPVHGYLPSIGPSRILSGSVLSAGYRKLKRVVLRQPWEAEITDAYLKAFRQRPAAVLAEYGPTGVRVIEACARAGLPLIVHFHGYDASVQSVLAEHESNYRRLFAAASAIVAVSHTMRSVLIALGAPPEKVHYNPCGVDCSEFEAVDASSAPPLIITAGRMVEKKAPHLTLMAFAEVHRQYPEARLHMIGDGPLMGPCLDLTKALGLSEAVAFLGHQPHERIRDEMREARCFAQHSIVAHNGDSEGTPVAVMEAGASGLPVVATRHAGIGDVVADGETGFLVEERDVKGMAQHMLRLMVDPALAGRLGRAARIRVQERFSMDQRIERLWSIIQTSLDESSSARPKPRAARRSRLPAGASHSPALKTTA